MIFDPISLTEAITPPAVHAKLHEEDYISALKFALVSLERGCDFG